MTYRILPLLLLTAALFGGAPSVHGQAPAEAAAHRQWLGEQDYRSFRIEGDEKNKADSSIDTFDTPAGKKEGFRFTVREAAKTPLAVQALVANPQPVTAKDTLFAHFFMRTVSSELESGEGKVQFILEDAKTYDKSVQFPAMTANDWKEFNLPFASHSTYAPGSAHVIFRLGYRRQTVEIAGLEIRNYGSSVPVASLPMSKPDLSYPGMASDAPWRAAADERIKKIRQSPLTIEVVDSTGRPVAGAAVEVKQTRHAFEFGSAIRAQALLDSATGADKRFSEAVLANFNVVTFENDLKWGAWDQNREVPLAAARWCKEHAIALRGHNMVWPSWRHLPPGLKDLQSRPNDLRAAVLHHVEDIGSALAPYAQVWDVVNEPYDNHSLMDILGNGILTDIYRQARVSAPEAKLFINDYGIVTGNGSDTAHQNNYEQNIQFLLDQHAPLEGIGLQGHFGQEFTSPERIYAILDRFAKFNLPLQMTEFTAQADDLEMDARVLHDVMTIFFSHPAVNAFVFWGFYDEQGFAHKATLYDAQGQLTPVGRVYRDLVFHRWWTHENTITAQDGTAQVNGFHGRYEVSVSLGGAQVRKQTEISPGGSTLRVVLGKD